MEIHIGVKDVTNGFLVSRYDDDGNTDNEYIAEKHDDVAAVVKQIIRGAFDSEEKVEVEMVVVDGYPVTKKVKADE